MFQSIKSLALCGVVAVGGLVSGASQATAQDVCMLGEIRMFGGNFAPRGWAIANGALLSIEQNSALFSLYGTTYGGDGRTTFGLPDLRGRGVVGVGAGPGLTSRGLGQKFGAESTTLSAAQLLPAHTHDIPGHSHSVNATTADGESTVPTDAYLADDGSDRIYSSTATADTTMNAGMIAASPAGASGSAGSGTGVTIPSVPPSLVINHIVCMSGYYPSRS